MTRKQLRTLLENFKIDPSFIIVAVRYDRATIRCKDTEHKESTEKILKENNFRFITPYKYMDRRSCDAGIFRDIEFEIPEKYRIRDTKTYMDVLCDLDNVILRNGQSKDILGHD